MTFSWLLFNFAFESIWAHIYIKNITKSGSTALSEWWWCVTHDHHLEKQMPKPWSQINFRRVGYKGCLGTLNRYLSKHFQYNHRNNALYLPKRTWFNTNDAFVVITLTILFLFFFSKTLSFKELQFKTAAKPRISSKSLVP